MPSREKSALAYRGRNSGPNYSEFKAEIIDSNGREYQLARLQQEDEGNTLLWCRLPISLRRTVQPPDTRLGGESLKLLDLSTMKELRATVHASFFAGAKAVTGSVVLADLRVIGDANPEEWSHLIDKEDRIKPEKHTPFTN